MNILSVTQMRIRFGVQRAAPKPPPAAWFNLQTESMDYGSATIDLARNSVSINCNSSVVPGISNLQDGILVVCGLPILKRESAKISSVEEAIQALKNADGYFAAVGYIPEQETVIAMTDFMGVMPLFVHQSREGLEITITTTRITTEPDLAAWGALLSMGHSLGERSLAKEVRRLRPGVVEHYDTSGRRLKEEKYWSLPEDGESPSTSEVAESLRANARDFSSVIEDTSVLLSGGFDSRLILCVLKDVGVDCDAVIVSHRDEHADNDAYLARRIAKKLGVKTSYHEPPRDFFSSREYLSYMQMTDAAIPSLYLFIAQVAGYVPERGVWEGMIPGFSLPSVHAPAEPSWAALIAKESYGRESQRWESARKIFKEESAQKMWEGFQSLAQSEMRRFPETHDGIWRFVISNRMRIRTAQNPLMACTAKACPLLLGTSQDFWTLAAAIPHERRRQHIFYKHLFLNEFPTGAQVPFLSGSNLTNAGGWSLEKGARSLMGKGHQWIKKRPRKARLLGFDPKGFEPSRFLDHPALFEPEDNDNDMLDWEMIHKHKAKGSLNATDRALIFQWKAWKWVQEGKLMENLETEPKIKIKI